MMEHHPQTIGIYSDDDTRNRLIESKNICTCDHTSPSLRVLRSTVFNQILAAYFDSFGLSGDGLVDQILNELYEYRTGSLFDFNGQVIPVDSEKREDVQKMDDLFARDQRRSINRYLSRAGGGFRYRLQMRMVFPVMMIHFAREIHLCRTSGRCAGS